MTACHFSQSPASLPLGKSKVPDHPHIALTSTACCPLRASQHARLTKAVITCGCVCPHVAIGNEPHVWVLCRDGAKERQVVVHVIWLAAVLHKQAGKLLACCRDAQGISKASFWAGHMQQVSRESTLDRTNSQSLEWIRIGIIRTTRFLLLSTTLRHNEQKLVPPTSLPMAM